MRLTFRTIISIWTIINSEKFYQLNYYSVWTFIRILRVCIYVNKYNNNNDRHYCDNNSVCNRILNEKLFSWNEILITTYVEDTNCNYFCSNFSATANQWWVSTFFQNSQNFQANYHWGENSFCLVFLVPWPHFQPNHFVAKRARTDDMLKNHSNGRLSDEKTIFSAKISQGYY